LLGKQEGALLHYTGGISLSGDVRESLHINNGKRVIGVTFGVPENNLGSLLAFDLAGSIALEELSGVEYVQGGDAVVYDQRLPKPGPFKGAAQFRDFSKVYKTINTLLR
ncbi:MAG: hypothetical protein AABX05_04735, partial [Nanoarchaeota archaeon]